MSKTLCEVFMGGKQLMEKGKAYRFYRIESKGDHRSTYVGGGQYGSDKEAVDEAFEYMTHARVTLNMVTEAIPGSEQRVVWTLKDGFERKEGQ